MKHKLIGRMKRINPSKKIWYDVVYTGMDPIEIELGDSLILYDDLSENTDELIVGHSNGTCNSDCWAHCHLESPVCKHILKCDHYHPRVCLVHIGEVLEGL